jgi:DNA-binding transcriptional regulator YhcF (GntR family)
MVIAKLALEEAQTRNSTPPRGAVAKGSGSVLLTHPAERGLTATSPNNTSLANTTPVITSPTNPSPTNASPTGKTPSLKTNVRPGSIVDDDELNEQRKKRKFLPRDLQSNIKRMAAAAIEIKDFWSNVAGTDTEAPVNKKAKRAINTLSNHLLDMASLAKYNNTQTLESLYLDLERNDYIAKMNTAGTRITMTDVHKLIRSFQQTSLPTFEIVSPLYLSDETKQDIMHSAFNVPSNESLDPGDLFTEGIFVKVETTPTRIVRSYTKSIQEEQKKGKHKKGTSSAKETTDNIWQTSLLENKEVGYKCSLGHLTAKEKNDTLIDNALSTYVLWIKEDYYHKWMSDNGLI